MDIRKSTQAYDHKAGQRNSYKFTAKRRRCEQIDMHHPRPVLVTGPPQRPHGYLDARIIHQGIQSRPSRTH